MSKKSKDKIGFLKDEPIKDSKKLKFGHSETVDALENIVRNNHNVTPITIGLFGSWGGGKSSLIESLRSRLGNKIPMVIFDVWKHEKDALRRTFLDVFDSQLEKKFKKSHKKDDRLQNSNSNSVVEPLLSKSWIITVSAILIIVLLAYSLYAVNIQPTWISNFLLLVLLPISSATFTFSSLVKLFTIISGDSVLSLKTIISMIIPKKTKTIVFDRYQDPAQFEEVFSKYLSDLQNRYKRVVIVFDNLDRVSADKAIELLTTINTFLDPIDKKNKDKEIVFLIPCDDSAIKNALKSNKTTKIENPDEFLKKFFNVHIRIPPFDRREIVNSTFEKLLDTKIKSLNDKSLALMITQFYYNNPRQVIQFINVLVAHYRLAEKRLGTGRDFEENWLSENIRQITRFLLLYEKYPMIFDWLYKKRLFSFDQLSHLRLDEWIADGFSDKKEELKKIKEQFENDWKLSNLLAPIPNSRFLYSLRKSEHEKTLPFLVDLQEYLQNGRKEEFLKAVKEHSITISNNIELFSQAVNDDLENLDGVLAASYITILIEGLKQNGIRLKEDSLGAIERLVSTQFQNDQLKIMNLKNLIDYLYPKGKGNEN